MGGNLAWGPSSLLYPSIYINAALGAVGDHGTGAHTEELEDFSFHYLTLPAASQPCLLLELQRMLTLGSSRGVATPGDDMVFPAPLGTA